MTVYGVVGALGGTEVRVPLWVTVAVTGRVLVATGREDDVEQSTVGAANAPRRGREVAKIVRGCMMRKDAGQSPSLIDL
jgi:hypothetical protein